MTVYKTARDHLEVGDLVREPSSNPDKPPVVYRVLSIGRDSGGRLEVEIEVVDESVIRLRWWTLAGAIVSAALVLWYML